MYKGYLFIVLLMSTVFACNEKTEELRIPPETLVEVLADVHLVEGALLSIRPAQKDSLKKLYYSQVYEIHEISDKDFEHDIKILKFNPKKMERIYEKVMEELNRKDAELKKESEETKK